MQHDACGTRQEGRSRLGLHADGCGVTRCPADPACLRSGSPESHPQRCINRSHEPGVYGRRVFVRKGRALQRVNAMTGWRSRVHSDQSRGSRLAPPQTEKRVCERRHGGARLFTRHEAARMRPEVTTRRGRFEKSRLPAAGAPVIDERELTLKRRQRCRPGPSSRCCPASSHSLPSAAGASLPLRPRQQRRHPS